MPARLKAFVDIGVPVLGDVIYPYKAAIRFVSHLLSAKQFVAHFRVENERQTVLSITYEHQNTQMQLLIKFGISDST
jgi:hypothetical protein